MNDQEIKRIDAGEGLSSLPRAAWELELDLGENSDLAMDRIRGVAREIALKSLAEWPTDIQWRELLPQWLVVHMPELSAEECERLMAATPREKWSTLPWQFESWLDAMRERGWQWWGYERSGRAAKLVLEVTSIPPRIEAFKQVVLASGATIVKERY